MNKALLLILLFITTSACAQFLPPTRSTEQGGSLSAQFNWIYKPNTLFAIDSTTKMVDSDTIRLLSNPNFESSVVAEGWTYSPSGADVAEIEATDVLDGFQSLKITPAAETFTLTQAVLADRFSGSLVSNSIWVKTDFDLEACLIVNSLEIHCDSVESDPGWQEVEIFGTVVSGSNFGLRLKSDSSVTGTALFDFARTKPNPLTPTTIYASSGYEQYTPIIQGIGGGSSISFFWKRMGDSIVIMADVTTGSPTGVEIQLGLPSGLVIDSSKVTTIMNVGSSEENNAGTDNFTILATGGDSFLNVGIRGGSFSGGLTPQIDSTVFGAGRQINFVTQPIPILGWSDTSKGVIVKGELSTDLTNENIFSTKIGSAGAIGVGEDMLDWIQGDCVESPSGTYTCTFNPDINFSIAPTCWVVQSGASQHAIISTSTTQVVYETRNAAGTLVSVAAGIGCQRASSDYVKKSEVNVVLPAGIAPETCYLKDKKLNGVDGGSSVTLSSVTRDLNATEGRCSFASLSSNQFTLQKGGYIINCNAPCYRCSRNQIYIRNITSSQNDLIGASGYSTGVEVHTRSDLIGKLEVDSPTVYELRHFTSSTQATDGLGVSANNGITDTGGFGEVYSQCKITKVR